MQKGNTMGYSAKYKTQKRIKVADVALPKVEKTAHYNSGMFTKVYQGKGKNNWIGYVLVEVFFELKLKLKPDASAESVTRVMIGECVYLNKEVQQATPVSKLAGAL
jgi:hypothetical protein